MNNSSDIILSSDILSATDSALDNHLLHAYCHQGSCSFVFNGKPFTLSQGDCMIISRRTGLLHSVCPSDDLRVDIIYVTQQFVSIATPQSNYGTRGSMALFVNPIMHLTPQQQEVCILDFDYIRRRLSFEEHHFHQDAMINAVQCMIIDFFDFHVSLFGDVHVSNQNSQLMQRFIDLLEQGHYRQHREVAYYADMLCVSAKHLSNVCRLISGESALQWITRYTSLEIANLLRNRSLTLEQIADDFAFSSVNYFIRYVQKNLGANPSSLRQ